MISQYLAGQLPANESDAFERSLSEQPDLRDATEQILKFKEGLARLHERGELDALLRAPSPRRWLPYAAAAALAIVALGGLLWSQLSSRAHAMLALSPQAFETRGNAAHSIVGSYLLARTRGGEPLVEVAPTPSSGAIELRILPSSLPSNVRYSVRLNRLGDSGAGATVAQIDAGPAAPDGYVTVYVDSGQLKAGDYEASLLPAPENGAIAEGDRFVIRVH